MDSDHNKWMGIDELLRTRQVARRQATETFRGLVEAYPRKVDFLFKLCYVVGPQPDVNAPEGNYHSTTAERYYQLPYTFWEIFNLSQNGSYLEAGILNRHLLEVLIQAKYFQRFPEKLSDHELGKKRVQFRVMFDEFSPDFYRDDYGKLHSGWAHGGVIVRSCGSGGTGPPRRSTA